MPRTTPLRSARFRRPLRRLGSEPPLPPCERVRVDAGLRRAFRSSQAAVLPALDSLRPSVARYPRHAALRRGELRDREANVRNALGRTLTPTRAQRVPGAGSMQPHGAAARDPSTRSATSLSLWSVTSARA